MLNAMVTIRLWNGKKVLTVRSLFSDHKTMQLKTKSTIKIKFILKKNGSKKIGRKSSNTSKLSNILHVKEQIKTEIRKQVFTKCELIMNISAKMFGTELST